MLDKEFINTDSMVTITMKMRVYDFQFVDNNKMREQFNKYEELMARCEELGKIINHKVTTVSLSTLHISLVFPQGPLIHTGIVGWWCQWWRCLWPPLHLQSLLFLLVVRCMVFTHMGSSMSALTPNT